MFAIGNVKRIGRNDYRNTPQIRKMLFFKLIERRMYKCDFPVVENLFPIKAKKLRI